MNVTGPNLASTLFNIYSKRIAESNIVGITIRMIFSQLMYNKNRKISCIGADAVVVVVIFIVIILVLNGSVVVLFFNCTL